MEESCLNKLLIFSQSSRFLNHHHTDYDLFSAFSQLPYLNYLPLKEERHFSQCGLPRIILGCKNLPAEVGDSSSQESRVFVWAAVVVPLCHQQQKSMPKQLFTISLKLFRTYLNLLIYLTDFDWTCFCARHHTKHKDKWDATPTLNWIII